MSLTNTDPVKTDRFPVFDWPRIDVPAIHLGDVEAAEERALAQARAAFERHPHDIACFIAEPIQGEGGDNHMRPEFLQAMQRLCHEHDALFILDEVQTGGGTTGTPWAYQQLGLSPDIVAFAKKVQVGGIMAGRRVDQVPDNVFRQSGRINSTWGGGLVDMVRSRGMLEIVERDGLIPRAGTLGALILERLTKLEAEHPATVANVRGRGLMCAFDLPDAAARDALVTRLREEAGVLVLPVRPALRPAAPGAEHLRARPRPRPLGPVSGPGTARVALERRVVLERHVVSGTTRSPGTTPRRRSGRAAPRGGRLFRGARTPQADGRDA